jgi:hypothetical protein
MKSTNAVNISMNVQDITDATDYGLTITGITSSSGIMYYEIPVFKARYRVSYSTICRNIERVRQRRDARNYFVKVGGKNFVSCGIVTNRKKHTAHFKYNEFTQWLQCYHWDLVGTVTFGNVTPVPVITRKMERLFISLKRHYYDKTLVFIYACERNPSGDGGYHCHFMLGCQDEVAFSELKGIIENYLRAGKDENRANTDIKEYRWQDDYIGYVVSKIVKMPDDWAFLTSNFIN